MLHPSYTDLMQAVNSDVEPGEQPVVNSRYSIVLAAAKRARQIIDGSMPLVQYSGSKPLSVAVDELYKGKVKIITGEGEEDMDMMELDSEQEAFEQEAFEQEIFEQEGFEEEGFLQDGEADEKQDEYA